MIRGRIETHNLSVFAGEKPILRDINITIEPRQVFGIVGSSGAGKSTLLRCLNRLIELDHTMRVQGEIKLDGTSIYAPSPDVDALRARVGIIFQQPVVFPTTILKNTIFGVRHLGQEPKSQWPAVAERALSQAGLWGEVKDRLQDSALKLSVGQQQRLCLARTLAVKPEVILMDEPTSSLDPASTEVIEELILRLKQQSTIVLVTHNLRQAAKVTDFVIRIGVRNGAGEVLSAGQPDKILSEAV